MLPATTGNPDVAAAPILQRGHVTFGAFNRIAKASVGVIAAWARILTTVPTAHLVIKTPSQDSDADRQRLRNELAARGVDAARIELRGATSQAEHLAAHAEIDVMLDPFPHTGGVTTAEALIMGVPAVTLLGDHVAGRVSASLLVALGLDELVAESVDQYVEIAIRLAGQGDWLGRERAGIRDRLLASPIGDGGRYTRAVEDAYRTMWRRWCAEATNEEQPA